MIWSHATLFTLLQVYFLPKYELKPVLFLVHFSSRVVCFLPLGLVQLHHRAITLTQDETRTALSHTDLEQMWQRDLRPLLVSRYPGSTGSQAVQEVSCLRHL